MENFVRYLNAVDGSRSWTEIEPLFDAAFDPEATFATAAGEVDLARWKHMAGSLVQGGGVISDFQITTKDGRSGVYSMSLTSPGEEPLRLVATATFRDGRVIRVEPSDPAAYADLLARNR